MLRSIGVSLLLLSTVAATAQHVKVLDDSVARKNLVKSSVPVYPKIAGGAKVKGDVVVQAQIGKDGRVRSVRVLSGPAVLRTAAMNAVTRWQFKPFRVNGVVVPVTARLVVPFAGAAGAAAPGPAAARTSTQEISDQGIASTYFARSEKCHALVGERAATGDQARACREAALEADKFAPDSRFIERRAAYVYCATALMRNQELAEAVAYGDKAVAVVAQGHDDGSGASAAYAVRGQAEALHGDLPSAHADLTRAEDLERTALSTAAGQESNVSYKAALRSLLGFHADVLTAMGKDAEAAAHLKEADSLRP